MTQPSLMTRARTALFAFRRGLDTGPRNAKAIPLAWPAWREGAPQWQIGDFEKYCSEGFNANTLIYSAIMYKLRALTSAPMRAYTGTVDEPELLPATHPLSALLARPNGHQSWEEFHGLNTVYFNLSGNCYVFLDREGGKNGLPSELVPLRPDRVFIVPGKDARGRAGLQGYIYTPEGRSAWERASQAERRAQLEDGRAVAILPDDLIHVKLPYPGDPLEGMGYGLSPLSPMARTVNVDNAVTDYLDKFFQRGGVPPFWFSYKVPLDDNTIARLREDIQTIYGGYDNWTKPGVLDNEGTIQRMGLTFNEMGFEGLDERNESRILGPLGVPAVLLGARLGLENATYSNLTNLRRMFWEDTMLPESRLFEAEYQRALTIGDAFPMFNTAKVPALQRDIPVLVDAAYKIWQMGKPSSVAFATVGLAVEEADGDDVGFIPTGMMPIELALNPPAPQPQPAQLQPGGGGNEPPSAPQAARAGDEADENEDEGDEDADEESKAAHPKAGGPAEGAGPSSGLSEEAKLAQWKRVDEIAQSWEQRFGDEAARQFEQDKRELLARLRKALMVTLERKATVDWLMIEQDWEYYLAQAGERWREAFVPLIQGLVTAQGNAWNAAYGISFDVRNLFALRWFDEYTMRFAQPIMETTTRDIASMLQVAMNEGWSIPRMQGRLETLFTQYMTGDLTPEDFAWFEGRMPAYRREMIARTETIRASQAGSEALYSEWGVQYKEWLTAIDERTCPWCNEMHGKVIATGDKWFSKGDTFTVGEGENARVLSLDFEDISHPPLHTNCRCTLIPVVGEQAIAAAAAQQAGTEAEQIRQQLIEAQEAKRREIESLRGQLNELLGDQWRTLDRSPSEEALRLFAEYNKRIAELSDRIYAIEYETKGDYIDLLGVANPSRLATEWHIIKGREAVQEGISAFERLVPQGMVDNVNLVVIRDSGTRSWARGQTIAMADGADSQRTVHELGHFLEDNNEYVKQQAAEFYERRTAGEKAEWLGDHYSIDEIGKRDKFINTYMGKEYMAGGARYGTEIVSMGLEYMYADPVALATKDPEYFDFIYNVVRGLLQ